MNLNSHKANGYHTGQHNSRPQRKEGTNCSGVKAQYREVKDYDPDSFLVLRNGGTR